ncbi:MAG TPA: uracil-DNA glycosylase [Devosia sp.]|nr:uracil-DNA glycosylase [Devosia sp.]
MTDDKHLSDHASLLGLPSLSRATTGAEVSERTATVIWDALKAIDQPIFLWNVFPLHPHAPSDEMTNRLHTREEREASRPLLDWLLENLKPRRIIAIGRDAQNALSAMGITCEIVEVRHPSYGGQREFTESIQRLYGYKSPQSDLFA